MRLNIFFQYLLGALIAILVFATLLWKRTELIVKETIVDKTYSFLHEKNMSKLREVDSKIDLYLLSAQELYEQLSKKREVSGVKNIDPDIVGADLVINKDNKFSVYSSFLSKEFITNRSLNDDFFKEIVGQNPINFSALQFQKVVVQKLTSEDKKTELLSIASKVSAADVFGFTPYYLVIYVDLKRFRSIFQFDSELAQHLLEPVGGFLAGHELKFADISQYPPFKSLNGQNSNFIKSSYKEELNQDGPSKDTIYYSASKSNYGYFISTEVKESSMYKPVYLLKSNYSLAVGILLSIVAAFFVGFALMFLEKRRKIDDQIENFVSNRTVKMKTVGSLFRDEMDDVSEKIYSSFQALSKVQEREHIIRRFSHTRVVENMQFKNFSVDGTFSSALIAKIRFELKPADEDSQGERRTQNKVIFNDIEKIAQSSEGVFISISNNTLTYAWGLFESDSRIVLKALEAIMRVDQVIRDNESIVAHHQISVSYGDVTTESYQFANTPTIALNGAAMDEAEKLIHIQTQPDLKIAVTAQVKALGTEYFGFVPGELYSESSQAGNKNFRQDRNIKVFFLAQKLKDYLEDAANEA